MKRTPDTEFSSFLRDAIARAQSAADACVALQRSARSEGEPVDSGPWAPFQSREEWAQFDYALDVWLEARAAKEKFAA
jgi:hypothetical protein